MNIKLNVISRIKQIKYTIIAESNFKICEAAVFSLAALGNSKSPFHDVNNFAAFCAYDNIFFEIAVLVIAVNIYDISYDRCILIIAERENYFLRIARPDIKAAVRVIIVCVLNRDCFTIILKV